MICGNMLIESYTFKTFMDTFSIHVHFLGLTVFSFVKFN